MKNYHEMIQFTVDQVETGQLRYSEWVASLILAEVYEIPPGTVSGDIKFECKLRETTRREARRIESRASNDRRRLANLANM